MNSHITLVVQMSDGTHRTTNWFHSVDMSVIDAAIRDHARCNVNSRVVRATLIGDTAKPIDMDLGEIL